MGRLASLALAAALVTLPARASAYTVDELAAGVRAVLGGGPVEAETLLRVGDVLARFLRDASLDESATHPHPGLDVTTYLLHREEDGAFSIAVLVIRPGGETPIHDHHTWTVWGTLRGRDRETRFERRGAGAFPDLVPRAARELAGEGVSLIPGPPEDIHRLENVGTIPSVSIHVHGADMSRQTRNAYDERKRMVVPFVQSYVEPGSDRP